MMKAGQDVKKFATGEVMLDTTQADLYQRGGRQTLASNGLGQR